MAGEYVKNLDQRVEILWQKFNKIGSGGGGTSDYSDLTNKPQINSTELSGNKSSADLGLASATDMTAQQAKTVGMGNGDTNYITVNGIRVYVASTAPTGTIPEGSIGLGF